MRHLTPRAFARRTLADRIDWHLAGTGLGFNPYVARRQRMEELAALDALSDRELLARGLRRDTLVAHVFRDLTPGEG